MASNLQCPDCYEDLGKDTENTNPAYCGNCGKDGINNPRGYNDADEDEGEDEYEQRAHSAFANAHLK